MLPSHFVIYYFGSPVESSVEVAKLIRHFSLIPRPLPVAILIKVQKVVWELSADSLALIA